MPRHFMIEVEKDNIRVDEVTEDGTLLSTYHNTDVTRFIDQNNVLLEKVEKKPRSKFKNIAVTIADDDIFETYKLKVSRHEDGTVTDITYGEEV